MSAKPETRFTQSVHTKLRVKPYFEKMHNPYRGGTWDVWYSGHLGDLWIEYKWLERLPRLTRILLPALSPLQLKWGLARQREGRRLACVVGTPDGGVWLDNPQHWIGGIHVKAIGDMFMTRSAIADRIGEITGRSYDSRESSEGCEDSRIVL